MRHASSSSYDTCILLLICRGAQQATSMRQAHEKKKAQTHTQTKTYTHAHLQREADLAEELNRQKEKERLRKEYIEEVCALKEK